MWISGLEFSELMLILVQIYNQLVSQYALPWEEGRISAQDKIKLGQFRWPIMRLLQREASQRATALQFCQSIRQLFESNECPQTLSPELKVSDRTCF
jgi:hypothetical protein